LEPVCSSLFTKEHWLSNCRLWDRAFEPQVELPVHFRGQCLGIGLRLDLLVDERLIVEVKSVARLDRLHVAQVLTYLRVAGLKTALLINFNSYRVMDGIQRISV
jgi:GxxExxY protein